MHARTKQQIKTLQVLEEVFGERVLQEERYGHVNDDLLNGTGSDVAWLFPYSDDPAETVERTLREDYEGFEAAHGQPTWMHLVREEITEAFQESDPARLAEELIQVAALCVSWVERLPRG